MEEPITESYVPASMALRAEASAVRKAHRRFIDSFFLAVQAGSFVALGGAFFTLVIHDSTLDAGMTSLVGGLCFSLGLVLVIVAGGDLFTGDTLMVMARFSGKVTGRQMWRSWSFVFLGNLFGALAIVLLISLSGHWSGNGGAIGTRALSIANAKVNLGLTEAITRGILCNLLVCLAIWLCFSCRSVTDKILAICFPITAFVALGLEHSIANMYFIPAGLVLKNDPSMVAGLLDKDLSNLTVSGFLLRNLLPVTFGNIVGGALFVGTVYWILYLRKPH